MTRKLIIDEVLFINFNGFISLNLYTAGIYKKSLGGWLRRSLMFHNVHELSRTFTKISVEATFKTPGFPKRSFSAIVMEKRDADNQILE